MIDHRQEVIEAWIKTGLREEAIKAWIKTGLMTREQAEAMLDSLVDYVIHMKDGVEADL